VARALLKSSTLQNAYAAFWNAFSANTSPHPIRALHGNGFHAAQSEVAQVCMQGTFFFGGWPYRDQSATGKVDILAEGFDTYDCKEECISASTVRVRYRKYDAANAKNRKLLLQLHYDFLLGQGPRHPFFHAQCANVKFKTDLSSLNLPEEPEDGTTINYPSVRIPTPFVGLPGLLVSLAADHWSDSEFARFFAQAEKTELIRNWQPSCQSLRTSFSKHEGSVHNYHWYGHAASKPSPMLTLRPKRRA
jgi:hypothetical protein